MVSHVTARDRVGTRAHCPAGNRRRPRSAALGRRALAVAAGISVDALLGEPPFLHPVAGFGRVMTALEQRMWRDARGAGVGYVVAGACGAWGTGMAGSRAVGSSPALGASVAVCTAGRALFDAARELLPVLAGRSPEGLDEKEIARAVVESVAENLSDAVVASAIWGLAAGAPGVLVHRAVNTLDAMVGHKSARYRRFGWAAARADDVMAWPAARATAALVALARPARAAEVWRTVRRDARRHPSPNAGVAEAAFAAALGLRLGGVNRYGDRVEVRGALGTGRPPEPADIRAAVDLGRRTTVVLVLLLGAAGGALSRLARAGPSGHRPRGGAGARRRARKSV